jgi:heme exporter protein A
MTGSIDNCAALQFKVKLENVSRRFGSRTVFSDVCGEVHTGQALVVSGPNGSGKSTLLKIAAGLLPATSGKVFVSAGIHLFDAIQRRAILGYAAPDLTLYSELTGAENLRFFARVRGLSPTTEELRDLLHRVGLAGRGRDHVGNYSSGMKQRLKYAFALLHRPPILILDEPTANLDSQGVEMAESIVREQIKHGLVLIATNEPREVAWGNTVVRLDPG